MSRQSRKWLVTGFWRFRTCLHLAALALFCNGCPTLPLMPEGISARSVKDGEGGVNLSTSVLRYYSNAENCCIKIVPNQNPGYENREDSFETLESTWLSVGAETALPWDGGDFSASINPTDGIRLRTKFQFKGTEDAKSTAMAVFVETGISYLFSTGILGSVVTLPVKSSDISLGAKIGAAHYHAAGLQEQIIPLRPMGWKNLSHGPQYVFPYDHGFADAYLGIDWKKLSFFISLRSFLPTEYVYSNSPWSTNGKPELWHYSPMVSTNLVLHFGR